MRREICLTVPFGFLRSCCLLRVGGVSIDIPDDSGWTLQEARENRKNSRQRIRQSGFGSIVRKDTESASPPHVARISNRDACNLPASHEFRMIRSKCFGEFHAMFFANGLSPWPARYRRQCLRATGSTGGTSRLPPITRVALSPCHARASRAGRAARAGSKQHSQEARQSSLRRPQLHSKG